MLAVPIGLSLNSRSSIASLQVSQLVIDYLTISENAAKKIILTDSRQHPKERERSRTRKERETFEQTSFEKRASGKAICFERKRTLDQRSQRREEQALRQSSLRDRETLEQRSQRREEQALLQSALRDRETSEEQLRRKQLDA